MELHIEAQHTEVDPTLRDWIRARCEAFNTPHEDIVHARVTLVKHPRHMRGSEEARVVLTLSGKIINVTRTGETLEDALYAVFDVVERELHDFRTLRRGVSKDPGPRVHGRIVRVFPDEGYGFIETESHREVYFHANAVHGIPFTQLQVDTVVDLDIEAGHQGPPGHPGHAVLAVESQRLHIICERKEALCQCTSIIADRVTPWQPSSWYRSKRRWPRMWPGRWVRLSAVTWLHVRQVTTLATPVASIGGAGTFGGVFLTGIIAVLLA